MTDLDNTLWDWFDAWFESFAALLDRLVELSGVDRGVLEQQVREVHQARGTTEYSNLLREVPALVEAAAPLDPTEAFDKALHTQNSVRRLRTRLYPRVGDTLRTLRGAGVRIAAYTESGAFWTEWRLRHTGLDGLIDVLYSSPDHDLLAGVKPSELRTGHYDDSHYGLRTTTHRHLPLGVMKPNVKVLRSILDEEACQPSETVYVGDSLMKDIAMAQDAGVLDVYAAYGRSQDRPEYDLLRRVTHWSDDDVERERRLTHRQVVASVTCRKGFDEVLPLFGLTRVAVQ